VEPVVTIDPARPTLASVSHLCVYSSNPERSERFYVHDLGGVKRDNPENSAGVRYYFNPTQFVEVLPLPPGHASIGRMDHAAFNTADAEGMRTYLESAGVTVPSRVTEGRDGSTWFDVLDPEGTRIQFVQPPTEPRPVDSCRLVSSRLFHLGFIVHDRDLEDTFYRKILGCRPYWFGGNTDGAAEWISQLLPDGTDWMEYMVVGDPKGRGIPADMSQDTLGIFNHFAFGVANIEQAVTHLWNGGRLSARHDGPKIGKDAKWQFNMYDPDGTRVELMEFTPVGTPCCSPFTAAGPEQ
jgi:catechol 2,3-dioxygenase-like lactoylglutathione lyase family enzyme